MMSRRRTLALGALAAAALTAPLVIAAAPVINETVAIVDPNTPTQQAGVDAGGNLKVNCVSGCSAGSGTGSNNADGVASQSTGLGQTTAYPFLYNGSTFDRWTGSATRGADVNLKDVGGAAINTGHGTAAGSIRVELPTDGTGVVGLAAGTNIVGKVGIDQTTPGTTNGVAINAALPAGTNIVGKVGIDQTTPGTTNGVTIAPSSASSAGITAIVGGSAISTLQLKASAGNLYSVYANCTAACWLMVFNATAAPSNGATTAGTASGNMVECVPIAAGQATSINYLPGPPSAYSIGIYAAISSTGCGTLTLSSVGMIHGVVM